MGLVEHITLSSLAAHLCLWDCDCLKYHEAGHFLEAPIRKSKMWAFEADVRLIIQKWVVLDLLCCCICKAFDLALIVNCDIDYQGFRSLPIL
ncbi:unnamed protein product [Caretta caretta]